MLSYVDMASRSMLGNRHLVAPFAYRPGAPLLVGAIARVFHSNVATTFRICVHVMCVAFILCGFCFARRLGGRYTSAMTVAILLARYFYIIKWNVFTDAMVDIYVYPLLLLAFWYSLLVADLPLAYSKSMESHLSPIARVSGALAHIHDVVIWSCYVWWDKYCYPRHIFTTRPDRHIRDLVGSWRHRAVGTAIRFTRGNCIQPPLVSDSFPRQ